MARQTAEAAGSILVDGVVVQPSYRSTPWEAEARHAATAQDKVCGCVRGGGVFWGAGDVRQHRVCMRLTTRQFWQIDQIVSRQTAEAAGDPRRWAGRWVGGGWGWG